MQMMTSEEAKAERALRAVHKQLVMDSMEGPKEPVVTEDFWQGSQKLYVLFSGLYGLMSIPTDLFFRNAGLVDQSKLILRDHYHAWYQRGLPSVGDDVDAIARFIEKKIEESGAKDVRFVGNCKGGFAALLFCSLLKRGKAITFVPQTFLSPERQDEDPRQPYLVEELYKHRTEKHIYDLKPWMQQHSPDIKADIFVGNNRFDLNHARELEGFRNINITYVGEGGHRVAAQLNKQGLLRAVLAA
jgi:hypothetical protein